MQAQTDIRFLASSKNRFQLLSTIKKPQQFGRLAVMARTEEAIYSQYNIEIPLTPGVGAASGKLSTARIYPLALDGEKALSLFLSLEKEEISSSPRSHSGKNI